MEDKEEDRIVSSAFPENNNESGAASSFVMGDEGSAAAKAAETNNRSRPQHYQKSNHDERPTATAAANNKFHHYTVCMVPPCPSSSWTIETATKEQEEGDNNNNNGNNNNRAVWKALTEARTQLRDPGLFRWPPHANLLYPFVNPFQEYHPLSSNDDKKEQQSDDNKNITKPTTTERIIASSSSNNKTTTSAAAHHHHRQEPAVVDVHESVIAALRQACQQCEPFTVRLDRLGTFGGNKRGVLWVYPSSSFDNVLTTQAGNSAGNDDDDEEEPLIQLQRRLEQAFPDCTEQRKVSGRFQPHMTLSHFVNLEAAQHGQAAVEHIFGLSSSPNVTSISKTDEDNKKDATNGHGDDERLFWNNTYCAAADDAGTTDDDARRYLQFAVKEIYLLQRQGDAGQFARLATIGLGIHGKVILHTPPQPFELMPETEADWVRQERMELKKRHKWNNKGGRRGGQRRRQRRKGPSPRVPDTPEVIAAKRAARKAKREALLLLADEKEPLSSSSEQDGAPGSKPSGGDGAVGEGP